jgi:L-alanine-DL-glutamate epimerase-like enolase superfamily enzyme
MLDHGRPELMEAPPVASVESWLVRLPISRPVHFSSGTWDRWNYVVARVRTSDGEEGCAYGFLGEIPVDLMVTELVAPAVVGAELGDLRLVGEACAQAAGPPLVDLVRPAASLVEVCLWDLAAQDAGIPLWRLIAPEAARRDVPVMLVEHRRAGDTPAAFAERVAALARDGVHSVKVKHYGDAAETAARLAAIRTLVGRELELVVDVGWQWRELSIARSELRDWEQHELAWIEDPFPPGQVEDAASLRASIETPIGIGDLVTSVALAERLIDRGAVDVLRVDVTTMGGIAGVERLVRLAASAGVELSPELLAEVHQHTAFAWPQVRGVELYSPASGVWSGDAFVRPTALAFAGAGRIEAPEAAGSGLELDWDAVERHAVRSSRYPAR